MTERDRPAERLRAEPLVRQPRPPAAAPAAGSQKLVATTASAASRRTRRSSTRRSAAARATTSSSRELRAGRPVDRGHVLGARGRRHRRRRPTCCARSTTRSDGGDGFVSLEVSPDAGARHRRRRSSRPRSLHAAARPARTCMIKIPATLEGIPAIEETIAAGHQRQRHADLLPRPPRRGDRGVPDRARALRRRAAATRRPIASVASFFVSRVDTETDRRLPEDSPLRGKAAVANAKLAYAAVPRALLGTALGRAGGEGRAAAAAAVGVDVDQEPGVLAHAVRRRAHRSRHREHARAGVDRSAAAAARATSARTPSPRTSTGARQVMARPRRPRASTSTTSPTPSSARASTRSRRRSPTPSAPSRSAAPKSPPDR